MVSKDEKKGSKDSKKQKKSQAEEEEVPKQGISKASAGLSSKPGKPGPENQEKSPLKKLLGVLGKSSETPSSAKDQKSEIQSPSKAGKKKVVEKEEEQKDSSRRSSNISVEIEPDLETEPENWLQYNIPFDRTNKTKAVKWKGSEEYTCAELDEWPMPFQGWLCTLLPAKKPVKGKRLPKKPFHLIFNISEAVPDDFSGQVVTDVQAAFRDLLWLTQYCEVVADLFFDTKADSRLRKRENRETAANMVMRMFLECKDAKRAEETTKALRKQKKLGIKNDPDEYERPGEDESIARDFALPPTKPAQMTVYEDSTAEIDYKIQYKDWYERNKAKPTPYTGDERDMEIQPDPKRPL